MKIIDKTPFQNEQGQIDFMGRIQSTLKYGPNWNAELQAQTSVMAQLDRLLEKGFVLIRNFTLPESDIVVPFVLVGTHGVSVIYVTHLKGLYEAKGDQWNKNDQGRSLPAPMNLLMRVVRLAKATQVYMERQRITLPAPIEPVLMAANPGLQIETMRPIARVVMSDAIKQFASGLLQTRPVMRNEHVYDMADRIVTPHAVEPEEAAPLPTEFAAPARPMMDEEAEENPGAFNPSDLSFAFEEEPEGKAAGATSSPARPAPAATKNRILGMRPQQLGCLGLLLLFECCVLAAGGYYIFLNP